MNGKSIPITNCPHCNAKLDSRSEASGTQVDPTPGDFSICVHCTNYLIYDDDLTLRKLNESDDIPTDVLNDLLAVKYRIDMRNQALKLGFEFQNALRNAK